MPETNERALIREVAEWVQAAIEYAADLLAERRHGESAPDALMAIRHEVAEWVEAEMEKLATPASDGGEVRERVVEEIERGILAALDEARRERSAARAEAMTAQASLRRAKRELEAARERERALREAHERSVGVFRRACEIAEAAILAGETPETASARLRNAIEADIAEINALVALSTPQEASGGTTRWYCEYGCGCVLDSRSARYHDCRTPSGDGEAARLLGHAKERIESLHRDAGTAEWPPSDFGRAMLQARLETVHDLIEGSLAALRSEAPKVEGDSSRIGLVGWVARLEVYGCDGEGITLTDGEVADLLAAIRAALRSESPEAASGEGEAEQGPRAAPLHRYLGQRSPEGYGICTDCGARENTPEAARMCPARSSEAPGEMEIDEAALEAARERERAVRDEATEYLAEIAGMLADMHDGEECRFEGGDGCLSCLAQGRIGEMLDALAARLRAEKGEEK